MGDDFMSWFPSATAALRCASSLQKAFEAHSEGGERISIRAGINAGEPVEEDDDLFGTSVIVAARTAASASGGQIVVTDVVRQLVAGKEFLFADRGLSGPGAQTNSQTDAEILGNLDHVEGPIGMTIKLFHTWSREAFGLCSDYCVERVFRFCRRIRGSVRMLVVWRELSRACG